VFCATQKVLDDLKVYVQSER